MMVLDYYDRRIISDSDAGVGIAPPLGESFWSRDAIGYASIA